MVTGNIISFMVYLAPLWVQILPDISIIFTIFVSFTSIYSDVYL